METPSSSADETATTLIRCTGNEVILAPTPSFRSWTFDPKNWLGPAGNLNVPWFSSLPPWERLSTEDRGVEVLW